MRDILTIAGLLLITLVLAALIGPRVIDWAPYRAEVERRLTEAFGAPVALEGRFRVTLLPSLGVTADEAIVAGARARDLDLTLSAASLARGTFRVSDGTIGELDLGAAAAGRPLDRLTDGLDGAGPGLVLDRLGVARLVVPLAGQGGARLTITEADIRLAGRAGPLGIEGNAALGDLGGRVRLSVGDSAADGERRVRLTVDAPAHAARAQIEGTLKPGEAGTRFAGKLAAGPSGEGTGPAAWRLEAEATFEGSQLALTGIDATLPGEQRLTGSARIDLSEGTLSTMLDARRLDLDRLSGEGSEPTPAPLTTIAALIRRAPAGVPVALTLGADAIATGGESFERVALEATLDGPRADIRRLVAQWPGRAEIDLSGRFDAAGAPGFRGRLAARTDDLARLARDLGATPLPAPQRRLAARFRLDLSAGEGRLAVENLEAEAAGSRVSGSAVATRRADGGRRISATLRSPRIDLAALPALPLTGIVAGRDELFLDLTVDRLTAGTGRDDSARLEARLDLRAGRAHIHALALDGFGGAKLTGRGQLSLAGGRIEGRLAAPRAGPLAEIARRLFPGPMLERLAARADVFEPFDVALDASREGASAPLVTTLQGSAGSSRIGARIETPADPAAPTRAALTVDTRETAALAAQLGLPVARDARLGPGRVALSLDGASAADLTLAATLEAEAGRLETTGTLALDGRAARGEGRLTVSAEDGRALAAAFGWRAGAQAGHVALGARWRLADEVLRLEAIAGDVLGEGVAGELALETARGWRLTGRLALPRLSLAGLVAPALGAVPAPGRGAIWPSARFAAPPPPLVPFDLSLTAPVLDLWPGASAREARLRLSADEERLTLADLAAGFAGGRIGGSLTLQREGGLVRASAALTADGIDTAALVPSASAGARLSGRIDAAGSGESPAQIVARLAGGGQVRFTEARLPGLAPAALGEAWRHFTREERPFEARDVAAFLMRELGRGGTIWRAGSVEAPVGIANGTLRATPLTATLRGGTVSGVAALDLKDMSLATRLTLNAAPDRSAGNTGLSATVLWDGPLAAPRARIEAGTLMDVITVERVRLELERLEALEADQREKAFFARRARAERDLRRWEAEEEARRRAEEEAHRRAEAEARQRAEEEARRRAEEEARRRAEEEARQRAEEEARRRAEVEARRKAEEEARRRAEDEARRKAEEAAQGRLREIIERSLATPPTPAQPPRATPGGTTPATPPPPLPIAPPLRISP